MTQPRDPDAIVAAWLEDGPVRLPPETRSAITVALRTQPRAGRRAIPGGNMLPLNKLTTAAAIVLAAGLVSAVLLVNRGTATGPTPSAVTPSAPIPSDGPSALPADAVSTTGWRSFSSQRYAYDMQYPPNMSAQQSVRQWVWADQADPLSPANDLFRGHVTVTAFGMPLAEHAERDPWIASYVYDLVGRTSPCTREPVDLPLKGVDGLPVVFFRETGPGDCGGLFAFVQVDRQMDTFFIGPAGQEQTLEAMLATVRFR
jgi:hypothetical protein